jgi:hypothetical protein
MCLHDGLSSSRILVGTGIFSAPLRLPQQDRSMLSSPVLSRSPWICLWRWVIKVNKPSSSTPKLIFYLPTSQPMEQTLPKLQGNSEVVCMLPLGTCRIHRDLDFDAFDMDERPQTPHGARPRTTTREDAGAITPRGRSGGPAVSMVSIRLTVNSEYALKLLPYFTLVRREG